MWISKKNVCDLCKLHTTLVFHGCKASSFSSSVLASDYVADQCLGKEDGEEYEEGLWSSFPVLTWELRTVLVMVAPFPCGLNSRSENIVSSGFGGPHVGSGWPCSHTASDTLHLIFCLCWGIFHLPRRDLPPHQGRTLTFKSRGWQSAAAIETSQLPALPKLVRNPDDRGLFWKQLALEDFKAFEVPDKHDFFLHQGKISQKIEAKAHVINTQKAKQVNA